MNILSHMLRMRRCIIRHMDTMVLIPLREVLDLCALADAAADAMSTAPERCAPLIDACRGASAAVRRRMVEDPIGAPA